jgi:hypothetical protein
MDNILKAIIDVQAPGVAQTTDRVSNAVLKTETSLNRLSKSTFNANQSMINFGRVVQDAPYGLQGIANNIDPLVASLGGPAGLGIVISAVTTGLLIFGKTLFGTSELTKAQTEEFNRLSDAIQKVKDDTEALTSAVQFANQLGAINVKIGGFGDIQDLKEQAFAQQQLVFDIGQKVIKATENYREAQRQVNEKSNDDTKKQEEDALAALRDAQKEQSDAMQKHTLLTRSIALQRITDKKKADEEAKKLRDKELKELEKAQKEMLASRERWAKLMIEINGSVLKGIALRAGLNLLPKESLIANINDLSTIKQQIEDIKEKIETLQKLDSITGINTEKEIEELKKLLAQLEKIKVALPQVSEGKPQAKKEGLTDQEKAWMKTAENISGFVTPAITGMIDAISRGENAWESFGQAVAGILKALAVKLLETAILAGILSAITGGSFGGAKGFLGIAKGLLTGTLGGTAGIGSLGLGNGGGQVQFLLRGQDLYGSIAAAQISQRRLQG